MTQGFTPKQMAQLLLERAKEKILYDDVNQKLEMSQMRVTIITMI